MQNGNAVDVYMIISPKYESINFNLDNNIKNGNNSIVAGNICVDKIVSNPNCRPLNLNLENAYPPIEANITPDNVTIEEAIIELYVHFKNDVDKNNSE